MVPPAQTPDETDRPVTSDQPPHDPGHNPKDRLHGITLERILNELVEEYGWEYLGKKIRINCFTSDPSIKSSLTFLRKTPWARKKVEIFYIRHTMRQKKSAAAAPAASTDDE